MQINKEKFRELLGNSPQAVEFINSLTIEDINIIQLYYKYITQQVAKNAGITELALSEERRKEFQAKYGATDWQFAGLIDYAAEAVPCHGNCGKMVKYAYYAMSPQTGQELSFGCTCMSKFLGIPELVIKKMNKILAVTDEEVAEALSYGKYSLALKESISYRILFSLQTNEMLNKLFVKKAGLTAVELFINFMRSGFMLPKQLNLLITEAYTSCLQELYWNKDVVDIFPSQFSCINNIQRKYAPLYLSTVEGSMTLNPWDIRPDIPMSYLVQVPFRELLNSLVFNAYAYNSDYMRLELGKENAMALMNAVGQLNKFIPEAGADTEEKVATTAEKLFNYTAGKTTYTPAEILLNAWKTNNTHEVVYFFSVVEADDFLRVIAMYFNSILQMLK